MNRSTRNVTYVVIATLGILSLWGCPKKTEVTTIPELRREEAPVAAPEVQREAAPAQAAAKPAEEGAAEKAPAGTAAGLQAVYFDLDQAFIRADAREIMKANAEWLKAHPQVRIRVEGRCDERGTREYNQALGQRRAANAKKFLTDLGIPAARISLISYGKEKPVCSESTETCWQNNRRDDLVAVSD